MMLWKAVAASLIVCGAFYASAQDTTISLTNETRQVRFAERVVMNELVRELSISMRKSREACLAACPETGVLELAIGLLGINQNGIATDTLVNFIGLRLDGAGSEELNCQVLDQGNQILPRLKEIDISSISEHCRANFAAARKRELADITDVKVDEVCRSSSDIQRIRDELVTAIEAKTQCPY